MNTAAIVIVMVMNVVMSHGDSIPGSNPQIVAKVEFARNPENNQILWLTDLDECVKMLPVAAGRINEAIAQGQAQPAFIQELRCVDMGSPSKWSTFKPEENKERKKR